MTWQACPGIFKKNFSLGFEFAVAVPIGYSAAAGAFLIRWHRIDEKTEERIVPDHGVERILFRLDQDLHPVGFQGRMTAENPFRKAVCIVCDHLHAPVVGFEGRDVILPRTDCSEYHLGRIVGMDHLRIDPDVVLNLHKIVAGIAQGCEGTDKFDALRCIQAEDEERGQLPRAKNASSRCLDSHCVRPGLLRD